MLVYANISSPCIMFQEVHFISKHTTWWKKLCDTFCNHYARINYYLGVSALIRLTLNVIFFPEFSAKPSCWPKFRHNTACQGLNQICDSIVKKRKKKGNVICTWIIVAKLQRKVAIKSWQSICQVVIIGLMQTIFYGGSNVRRHFDICKNRYANPRL